MTAKWVRQGRDNSPDYADQETKTQEGEEICGIVEKTELDSEARVLWALPPVAPVMPWDGELRSRPLTFSVGCKQSNLFLHWVSLEAMSEKLNRWSSAQLWQPLLCLQHFPLQPQQ